MGRALAQHWAVPAHDTDDFFWLPTEPPFTQKRAIDQRLSLMEDMFLPRSSWVLSGSLNGWGDPLVAQFDLVVLLTIDPQLRLARLIRREVLRYGAEAIEPGGAEYEAHQAFVEWAGRYDDPTFAGRSLVRHQAWLNTLQCPVVQLDSARPLPELLAETDTAAGHARPGPVLRE